MSVDSLHANKRQLSVRRTPSMFEEWRKFSVPQTQRHMPKRDMWYVISEPEGVGEVSNVTVSYVWDSDDRLHRIRSADLHSKWLSLASTSEPADSMVIGVIEEASWVLLPDNSGDESAVHYQQATMDRARDFLLNLTREVRHYSGRDASVPAINPADAGSIDIFWDLEQLQLLVNVSADPDEPITFYGEDKLGTVVSGMRGPSQEGKKIMKQAQSDCLIVWLLSISG